MWNGFFVPMSRFWNCFGTKITSPLGPNLQRQEGLTSVEEDPSTFLVLLEIPTYFCDRNGQFPVHPGLESYLPIVWSSMERLTFVLKPSYWQRHSKWLNEPWHPIMRPRYSAYQEKTLWKECSPCVRGFGCINRGQGWQVVPRLRRLERESRIWCEPSELRQFFVWVSTVWGLWELPAKWCRPQSLRVWMGPEGQNNYP